MVRGTSRRRLLAGASAGAALAGLSAEAQQRVKSGTVDIEQVQVAFIGSGGIGGGTLHYYGRSYRFSIGGFGIGGFGVSKLQATRDVYNLDQLGQFLGAYGSARYGAAFGDQGGGQLWLENPHGVILSLRARRQGGPRRIARRRRRDHRLQVSRSSMRQRFAQRCSPGSSLRRRRLPRTSPQTFNAFAVVSASGSLVRAAEKQVILVGILAGPFFVETDEGPFHSGRVACAASVRIDRASHRLAGNGGCTFTATDGATAWGEWDCQGYEVLGCRGTFKLTGGTARLEGATGEAAMTWRPSAAEFRKQLDGMVLENATGLLAWRDFRLETK